MIDGQMGERRKLVDDRQAGLDVAQLLVQAHPDVTVADHRIALGMEGEKVDWRAGVDDMLQEGAQEGAGLRVGEGAAGMRSADTGPWQRALHRAGADIVHLAELLDRSQPVVAVGLVPHFPRPSRDFVFAVAIGQMPGPGFDQGAPFFEIVRRRCPAGGDGRGSLRPACQLCW